VKRWSQIDLDLRGGLMRRARGEERRSRTEGAAFDKE